MKRVHSMSGPFEIIVYIFLFSLIVFGTIHLLGPDFEYRIYNAPVPSHAHPEVPETPHSGPQNPNPSPAKPPTHT